jgi:ClpP class serine protease
MRRILEQVYGRPWFSDVSTYKSVDQVVQRKLNDPQAQLDLSGLGVSRKELSGPNENGIATIDIYGVTGKRLGSLEKACGACDYNDLETEIGLALKSKAKALLFTVDSGGGAAIGCAEVANLISSLPIPTAAFVDNVCASAAYYMASAADYIVCTSSALIGSIGVIVPWVDSSELFSLAGLKFDPITNEGADLKSAGHGPSLTDEQREHLQELVNDRAKEFQEFVAANRPKSLDPEVWRAGAYIGSRAVVLGLADRIGTLQDAYSNLQLAIQKKSEKESTAKRTPVDIPTPRMENESESFDVQAALSQLSTNLKSSLFDVKTSFEALESKVRGLTTEVAEAKAYSEALNKRYINLESERGVPSPVKQANEQLDPHELSRQKVNETIAAIKSKHLG